MPNYIAYIIQLVIDFFWRPHKYENNYKRNYGGPYCTTPATDLNLWRLVCKNGSQSWIFKNGSNNIEDENMPQSFLEKHLVGSSTVEYFPNLKKSCNLEQSIINGANFYSKLQVSDGHWAGDYGGPLFLMPGLIITCYLTKTKFSDEQRLEMIRYLKSVQTPDGGWGLHTQGPPTVFGTTLNYVALRLLGLSSNDYQLRKALSLNKQLGGALSIPSWGKFWLAILNLYDWQGLHSLCPEIWYLPEFLPFHPSKMWCHFRQVYLGMAYCYGVRLTSSAQESIISELRDELYDGKYSSINWIKHRNNVSPSDLYSPHSFLLNLSYYAIDLYEKFHIVSLRKRALDMIYLHIKYDDEVTKYISHGPISKVLQMLARWHRDGPDHISFLSHQLRINDYLWLGKDGLKMTGTNGSKLWDTTFAVQSILECVSSNLYFDLSVGESLKKAKDFLLNTQIKENVNNYKKYYRQPNKGGFPFSTFDCNWIVADCTAEGLKSLLLLDKYAASNLDAGICTEEWRFFWAVDLLLDMQNEDGGFATYEKQRGGKLLELLNPSEVFGDIMIDYSYVECTSAVIQALSHFSHIFPKYRNMEIEACKARGIKYIINQQQMDGSWLGSWGVCYTYGCWFGLEALAAVGYRYEKNDPNNNVNKACRWLVDHQLQNGGWGEKFESCEQKQYVQDNNGSVVNTAWALLALMAAKYSNMEILRAGIKFIIERQMLNGDFPQENTTGVFNKSCAIHYEAYRNVFPLWALGKYYKLYGNFDY